MSKTKVLFSLIFIGLAGYGFGVSEYVVGSASLLASIVNIHKSQFNAE